MIALSVLLSLAAIALAVAATNKLQSQDSRAKFKARAAQVQQKFDVAHKKHNITDAQVIVCAVLKHEELYVDEWIRYYQYLGFDFMYLYDNGNMPSAYLAGIHQVYGNFVRVKRLSGRYKQMVAYSDCYENFKNKNTWAALIDVDEFMVLRKHPSIKDFLRDVAPNGGAVAFNWKYISSSGIKQHLPGPVVARFTYTHQGVNQHIKTLSYLGHVSRPDQVHFTNMLPGHVKVDVQGRVVEEGSPFHLNNTGNEHVAYLNHYHTKSLEEFLLKKRRGRADISEAKLKAAERQAEINAKSNTTEVEPLTEHAVESDTITDNTVSDVSNNTVDISSNITVDTIPEKLSAEDIEVERLFGIYNDPSMQEVQDTFARDFYLSRYLGETYYILTQHNSTV